MQAPPTRFEMSGEGRHLALRSALGFISAAWRQQSCCGRCGRHLDFLPASCACRPAVGGCGVRRSGGRSGSSGGSRRRGGRRHRWWRRRRRVLRLRLVLRRRKLLLRLWNRRCVSGWPPMGCKTNHNSLLGHAPPARSCTYQSRLFSYTCCAAGCAGVCSCLRKPQNAVLRARS